MVLDSELPPRTPTSLGPESSHSPLPPESPPELLGSGGRTRLLSRVQVWSTLGGGQRVN